MPPLPTPTANVLQPYTQFIFNYVFVQFPYIGFFLTLQGLDIITGFLAAAIAGKASSSASWKGILKKVATWCAIFMVMILSKEAVPNAPMVRPVFWAFMANECLSMVENLALCGVPMPQPVIKALYALREVRSNPAKTRDLKLASGTADIIETHTIEREKTVILPATSGTLPDGTMKPVPVAIVNAVDNPVPVISKEESAAQEQAATAQPSTDETVATVSARTGM